MLTIRIKSKRDRLAGWSYFWAKDVVGFAPGVHCARCLRGAYVGAIGKGMPVNTDVPLDFAEGRILYVCGVASPSRWVNNFHLAVRVTPGESAELETYNGDTVRIEGARRLEFTDTAARRDYGERDASFLTCRNFQFGAAYF